MNNINNYQQTELMGKDDPFIYNVYLMVNRLSDEPET